MPQLAPLSWSMSALIFIFLLLMVTAVLWWRQYPLFPTLPKTKPNSMFPEWQWL